MAFNRLYIHVPFCESKCAYCAFYSETNASEQLIDAYLLRLEEEFKANSANCAKLDSIFIGGGTPNILSVANLAKLFNLISANFAVSENAEISIECNPESINSENAGIIANFANRVSIGVQSFNCEFRKILGRQGGAQSVFDGIEMMKKAGVVNIGCDLIYAIPTQSIEDWKKELIQAAKLGIKHISAYSLTYEEGTKLYGKYSEIQNYEKLSELEAEMWEITGDILLKNGLHRYEISNYATPGFECRHNLEIWYGDTYLGCGPAATSFDGSIRYTNPPDIQAWLNSTSPEQDIISSEQRAAEILIMGLRTSQGWSSAKFAKRTAFSIDHWKDVIDKLIDDELIVYSETTLKLTKQGLLLWDTVAEAIL